MPVPMALEWGDLDESGYWWYKYTRRAAAETEHGLSPGQGQAQQESDETNARRQNSEPGDKPEL